MNLEATLEDLEAQGFFATQAFNKPSNPAVAAKLVRVTLKSDNSAKYLTSPIMGSDFLGGFTTNERTTKWVAIHSHQISLIENIDGQTIMETQASLQSILQEHLLGVQLDITMPNIKVTGALLELQASFLKVQSQEGKLLWIPLGSFCYLAVENLSKQFKL
jgi:hypothetical protein